jgi:predicted glycosyltransferase
MRIWIDLSNSPHPLLFRPIARRLQERGHTVAITARDNAQTVELARERWPDVEVIGGVSPKGRLDKARTIGGRAAALRRWAAAERPDVALSHNSYAQIVAAGSLRVPVVTAMDFEHQPANHLAFRLAKSVLLPAALCGSAVWRQGATARKTHFYSGLKEEVYLADFRPDSDVLHGLGIALGPGETLVVARPAPDRAAYHPFENPLFVDCVKTVLRDGRTTVVVLPRHPDQADLLEHLALPRCAVVRAAVDSRSLMSVADLMIGAGGTMTREAALMGVPTLSLFAGHRPAVDRWLQDRGMLRVLSDAHDCPPVTRQPRADQLAALRVRGAFLVDEFCDATERAVTVAAPVPEGAHV